ncbi:CDGSH iron-sulfur domain-containing protein [Halalkalicoccus sp. NIPERK01]|uniref:CDGSH iron-sulfur domain-containing protein n=1 Tax=Halalkalicoccus sp. NIPERK01 TaxID=3053469 RepID=UPI00256EBE5F|nr:CDGSH iron-sulfur domain-containing protein [Halalkalicoccus sp. NIPERK01]MDL5360624.1 CDGSH iron-sulfur domain-containing protein [Halalkalicoccus sp. NIPERK01]
MEEDVHRYAGEEVDVTYDVNRCIHVKACVEGLSEVFDPEERPWIQPDNADSEEVASVVFDCPTGALHVETDGVDEPIPEVNRIGVVPDGPLYLHGKIEIETPEGEPLLSDTRVALCRCGASGNKPLCDDSHAEIDFADDGTIDDGEAVTDEDAPNDTLRLTPVPSGPCTVSGSFEIEGADGESHTGTETALCRCGSSSSKPFCDGTHSEVGFTGEDTGEVNRTGEERL